MTAWNKWTRSSRFLIENMIKESTKKCSKRNRQIMADEFIIIIRHLLCAFYFPCHFILATSYHWYHDYPHLRDESTIAEKLRKLPKVRSGRYGTHTQTVCLPCTPAHILPSKQMEVRGKPNTLVKAVNSRALTEHQVLLRTMQSPLTLTQP